MTSHTNPVNQTSTIFLQPRAAAFNKMTIRDCVTITTMIWLAVSQTLRPVPRLILWRKRPESRKSFSDKTTHSWHLAIASSRRSLSQHRNNSLGFRDLVWQTFGSLLRVRHLRVQYPGGNPADYQQTQLQNTATFPCLILEGSFRTTAQK